MQDSKGKDCYVDLEIIKSLRKSRRLDGLLAAIKRDECDINAFWRRWGGPSRNRNQSYRQANMMLADKELRAPLQNDNSCVEYLVRLWLHQHIARRWPDDDLFPYEDKFWQLPLAAHLLGHDSGIDQQLYPDRPEIKLILESHDSEIQKPTSFKIWETVYNLCQAQVSLNVINFLINEQAQGLKSILNRLMNGVETEDLEALVLFYDELTGCFDSIGKDIRCFHQQLIKASTLEQLHFLAVEDKCDTDREVFRIVLRSARCRQESLSRVINEMVDELQSAPTPAERLKKLRPIDDERDREIISSLIEACEKLDSSQPVEEQVPAAAYLLRHVSDGTSPSDDEMGMLKHLSWDFIDRLKKGELYFEDDLSGDASDKEPEAGLNSAPDNIASEQSEESAISSTSTFETENAAVAAPSAQADPQDTAAELKGNDHLQPGLAINNSVIETSEALKANGAEAVEATTDFTAENQEQQLGQTPQDVPIANLLVDDLSGLFEALRSLETPPIDNPMLDTLEDVLLDRRDTAAFYWLTKARNEYTTPLWLAKLVHLGANYHWRFRGIQDDFRDLLIEADMNITDCSQQQLTLAAAAMIRPVLMAPDPSQVGVVSVLKRDFSLYGLASLWDELLKLAQRGHIAAGEQTLSRLISQNENTHWHQELSNDTDTWFETAHRRKMPFAPATKVWQRLTDAKGALGSFIVKARAGGNPEELNDLAQQAQRWLDKTFIKNAIHSTQADMKSGGKIQSIDYKAKEAIMSHTGEAISLANSWISYHQQNVVSDDSQKWDYHHQILDTLAKMARGVIERLQDKVESSAQRLLLDQLSELADKYKNLSEHSSDPSSRIAVFPHGLDLNLRLIRIPGATLDGHGGNVSLPTLLDGLERDIDEAAGWLEHLNHGQYLLAAHWLTAHPDRDLPASGQEKAKCSQLLEEAVKVHIHNLKNELDRARDKVEGRYYCGAIVERSRDDLSRKLDKLSQTLESAIVDFRDIETLGKVQDIDQGIDILTDELDGLVEEQRQGLQEAMETIQSEHGLPPEAENFINELVAKGEIGAANDHLASFRDQLEHNGAITLPPAKNDDNYTSRFFAELGELASAADPFKHVLERSDTSDHVSDEAREYWKSWSSLAEDRGLYNSKKNIGHLTQILRWLGFTFERDEPFRPSHKEGRPHFWLKFDLTDVDIKSYLPRWGSQALGRHTLILGWSDHSIPPDEIIRTADSHRNDSNSSIIFMCFSRLDENARKKLGLLSRARKLCPLVIDQNLMAWLCNPKLGSLDRRQAMFQIGLAGGSYNPYTPEVAGAVPNEMFFGRQEAIEQLWDMAGSCLVYGGRQLGKSALLQQVRERYHQPDSGEYVLYGSAYSDTSIHDVVINMLGKNGLPLKGKGRLYPATLKDSIRDCLNGPARRIVLLIDESDNLLDADRKDGFKGVDLYRDIMQTTNRRFKIVLAGLHSVQRYQRYPNNPLAHFGTPMCIGPLSPHDAYDLIVKPMEVLGINFENDSLVYRVLSLTSYHPSLIQLFCSALVQQIHSDSQQQILPPLTVTESFIDKVYRRADLRESIKKRFDWTLDLDKRYRVIGYTMACLESLGDLEGSGEGITASQVLPDLQQWWPDAFKSLDLDTVESLMTEMVGLGLLSQVKRGFRLRNSNVIRLLGGIDNIEHELEPFKTMKYEEQGGAEGLRRILSGENNILASPLLFHQESDIRAWGIGVELVVGSRALGLDRVEQSLRSNDPEVDSKANPSPDIYHLDGTESCQRQIEKVKELYKKQASHKKGVLFIVDSEDNPYFWPVISEIGRWIDRLSSPQRYLRLVGLVHPDAYLELVQDDPLAGHPWPRIHHLVRWNEKAVDYYLSCLNQAGDKTWPLLECTGGWDALLIPELTGAEPINLAHRAFTAPANSRLFDQALKCLLMNWKDQSATLNDWAEILAEEIADSSETDLGSLQKMLAAMVELTLLSPISCGPEKEAQYKLDKHFLQALEQSNLASQ